MIGSFGSKLVSLIMVSFYSYQLEPSEYGFADVALTTIALVLPIVTCCLHEAVLSFILKSEYDRKNVVSSGMTVFFINSVIMLIVCACVSAVISNRNVLWVGLIIFAEGLNLILLQYSRAINKAKLYAASGIIVTFSIATANIVFLKYLHLGLTGYFLSFILAYSVSILIVGYKTKIYASYKAKLFSTSLAKKMLVFSLPLIPNSLMWWAMNALDKYVILYYLGSDYNGLYAVAGKIPTILSTCITIFINAWQVSAIMERDSADKDSFYTNVFNGLLVFCLLGFCGLMMVIRPVLTYAINSTYTDTWKYVPFLLVSTIFAGISSFLGANYLASQKTKGALYSSIAGGSVNLVLNFILIKYLKLNGAAIATAISFFIVCVIRIIDTRKFVKIRPEYFKIILYSIIIFTQILVFYSCDMLRSSLVSCISSILIVVLNWGIVKEIVLKFFHKLKKRN